MEKKRMNDKGFSLVELIIVIAIMAILIGVLAPQYLKFVERSRKSTDRQNVDSLINAVQIWAADPEANPQLAADSTGTVLTIKTTGGVTLDSGTNAAAIQAALREAGLTPATFADNDIKLKSSKWASTTITLTFKVDTNGSISVTASDPNILSDTTVTPTP